MKRMAAGFRFSGSIVLGAVALIAQTPAGLPTFQTGVDMLSVSVRVTDRNGVEVHGLTADRFTLLESGVRQTIAFFAAEEEPVSLAIMLDVSKSMSWSGELDRRRDAARIRCREREAHGFTRGRHCGSHGLSRRKSANQGLRVAMSHPNRLSPAQSAISGAAWTEQIKYDIEALPPKEAAITNLQHGVFEIADERLRQMLQSLLIRRFQLQSHRATEMGNVYLLKRGSKQPAFHLTDAAASSAGRVRILWSKRQLALEAATMPQLAEFLSGHVLGAPVLDRTGLSGRFDYAPENTAPDAPDPAVDLVPAALNFIEDIHLTLERTKGPVEVFVIDRAEKPSSN